MKTSRRLNQIFTEHTRLVNAAASPEECDIVVRAAEVIAAALRRGNTIFVCGNGGSASDSLHFAAEMVGRFEHERNGYPVIALTANQSVITSVANDYSFEEIFSRQIVALGKKGDVLLACSTSGSSCNVLRAAQTAISRNIAVVALTGKTPNPLTACSTISIAVNSSSAARIQEIHIIVIHALSMLIEEALRHEQR